MTADQLPPLDALQVLESCVRNRSFSIAATELRLSSPKVSEQIKDLEHLLDITLFIENSGEMEPTDSATALADRVRQGLNSFAAGIDVISRARNSQSLNLFVSPYFANRFLASKLDALKITIPELEIQLTMQTDPIRVADKGIGLAILHGYEDWKSDQWSNFHTKRIITDHKIVCCSSGLMKGEYPIRRASALCGYPLLKTTHSDRLWQSVLSHLEIDHPDPGGGMTFSDHASMQEATAQGLGIGLISRADAAEGISSGRLVAPLGEAALSELPEEHIPGFYLLCAKDRQQRVWIQSTWEWLCEQQWGE